MANLKVSEQAYPSTRYTEGAAPSTPASGEVIIYAKADGLLYQKDDAGTETLVANSAAGAVATDAIWDAAGDLAVGSGANTAAKLTKGSDGDVLTVTAGVVGWAAGGGAGAVATDTIWDAAGDLVQGTGANTGAKLTAGTAGNFLKSAGAAAANVWEFPPGHEFDYVQITSNVSIGATSEATATTAITGNAVAYDGSTAVIIEFMCDAVQPGSGGVIQVALYDGSSSIGRIAAVIDANGTATPTCARRRITPTAATHTYSIRAWVASSTGTINAGTGASTTTNPAYIRITKV